MKRALAGPVRSSSRFAAGKTLDPWCTGLFPALTLCVMRAACIAFVAFISGLAVRA